MIPVFVVVTFRLPFDGVVRAMHAVGFEETARRECLRTLSGKIPEDKHDALRKVGGVITIQIQNR